MYPFHSSGTRNSLLRHDTAEEKKRNLTMMKRSMYPFHSFVSRRQRLTEGVSEAWCFKKIFELFDSIIIYGYVYSFWYKMMAL